MGIWLVRHGETALNASRVLQPPDTPLSPRGLEQAALLALRLREAPVAAILSSDHRRARMTAEVAQRQLGVGVDIEPLLQERSFGDLRGTPYDELTEDVFAPGYSPPGGESWEVFHERVARAWERVTERAASLEAGADLLVVSHGLVCRAIFGRHLRPAAEVDGLANTAVTRIDGPPWRATLLGCVAHLSSHAGEGAPA